MKTFFNEKKYNISMLIKITCVTYTISLTLFAIFLYIFTKDTISFNAINTIYIIPCFIYFSFVFIPHAICIINFYKITKSEISTNKNAVSNILNKISVILSLDSLIVVIGQFILIILFNIGHVGFVMLSFILSLFQFTISLAIKSIAKYLIY
ncbi:hypothetical protein JYG23_14025 [Sedimentibacter sp. zth1]|uniref:hypothetical protein n=1 Tax=Sedimentibacter sp. zth1 TaxID=2816908 RepID=UPI001A933517|nr:hypothetical protein [Sedimentibacter sp. zth1]QSX05762.1 hypothetical protein JYG23_14025 [Sedimentibacter sp. zth1]